MRICSRINGIMIILLCMIIGSVNAEFRIFEQNELQGLIDDRTGEIILPAVYSQIAGFCDGYSVVVDKDGGVGLIDEYGRQVAPCIYESVSIPQDGYFVVQHQTEDYTLEYIFFKADGKPTGWFFEYASDFQEGYAMVIDKGTEYLLDTEGNLHMIFPYHFASGDGFCEGRLLVMKDGMYGYMDETLQLVIPCVYEWADTDFCNGVTSVRKDGQTLTIDKWGKIINVDE